jgi:dipeptidyl aminopeptidase/acylaminoacyl peptidase
LILLLLIGLLGWLTACAPAVAEAPPLQPQPYTVYLATQWSGESPGNSLVPLDPETLDELPGAKALESRLFSVDGSTAVDMEYLRGRANPDPEDSWIVVYDLLSGAERNRFHPPASAFVSGISEHGSRLLLRPNPHTYTSSHYPPTVEWYVVDTSNGELLVHLEDGDNACFRQQAHFDPAGRRIYCVVDPDLTEPRKPEPMRIVAYDVESGLRAGEVELPGVLIGGEGTERNGQLVEEFLEPAVALSPDGGRLAVVHADSDEITLIDARSLSVEKGISLGTGVNLWESLGFVPAIAHAKGEMEGTIRQAVFSPDGQRLYVFTQEIVPEAADPPAERGLWLVDLARGDIAAQALPEYQVQWLRPAPDGTVFAFGTTDERLLPFEIRSNSPSMLWRLDDQTLEILAERALTGYRRGVVVEGAAATATSAEAAPADGPYQDCPVTQPPETPFVPPEPWPAQPPGSDQFWYGDNALWTALPAGGSWRQLALGEKFWWWSEKFDVAEDATPDLTVTARHLDGDAPDFQTSEATNGYHHSFNWAMLSGVKLASPECWEFTGEYKGHELSFVLWVPSE